MYLEKDFIHLYFTDKLFCAKSEFKKSGNLQVDSSHQPPHEHQNYYFTFE